VGQEANLECRSWGGGVDQDCHVSWFPNHKSYAFCKSEKESGWCVPGEEERSPVELQACQESRERLVVNLTGKLVKPWLYYRQARGTRSHSLFEHIRSLALPPAAYSSNGGCDGRGVVKIYWFEHFWGEGKAGSGKQEWLSRCRSCLQLCEGATPEERKRWFLKPASEFHYLNQSTCYQLPRVDNAEEFQVRLANLDNMPTYLSTWRAYLDFDCNGMTVCMPP
jgi:hypothetical protein